MNQKLEEQLKLALLTPEEIREKTADLNIGFDAGQKRWTLIAKYHGEIEKLTVLDVTVEKLLGGYAILTVPNNLVDIVAGFEEIEYVEKPKRFYYGQVDPVSDSCISELPGQGFSLSGKGVLIAIIDSGVEYSLPVFRDAYGRSRIEAFWDQTGLSGKPPEGFAIGTEYDREALERGELMVPDITGHGTAVASVAAGYGEAGGNLYFGTAPEATLLVVKLGSPSGDSFPRTTDIMRGVSWALQKAAGRPLVINLSFGNNNGAHDGSALLEQFLNDAAGIGRTVICVGSGNEGAAAGHISGELERGENRTESLVIGRYERSLNMQLWIEYGAALSVSVTAPDGTAMQLRMREENPLQILPFPDCDVYVYLGDPAPYSVNREVYFEWIPRGMFLEYGIWTFRFSARVKPLFYECYLGTGRSAETVFLQPDTSRTLTIPSAAERVITVGAYDGRTQAYAAFSGRGADAENHGISVNRTKPDLVASGVLVEAVSRENSILPVTGTSFAAPIVSGSAALLMEWGIVQGNDPFLYGEKMKAYLRKGAQPVRGETILPNNKTGWGKLCVRESLGSGAL